MKRVSICSAMSLFVLTGCGGVESEVKNAVLAGLKDPDSAKFGSFKLVDDEHACLTVNAKNSMGGYTGNQQAFVKKTNGVWKFIFSDDVTQAGCAELWPKIDK